MVAGVGIRDMVRLLSSFGAGPGVVRPFENHALLSGMQQCGLLTMHHCKSCNGGMDRLEAMRAFVEVRDAGGFAAAARRLKTSPSNVTRLVAHLEDHLGVRLLQRTTRSVTLTDSGARYLERARKILADVVEAEAAAEDERAVPSGRFVVAAPQMFGRMHVAPLVGRLLQDFPTVVVDLLLADRMVHLVEEGVDAAVRIGTLEDSSLVARQVGLTRRVVVASPKYLTRTTFRTPEDVTGHPVAHFTALGQAPEWGFVKGADAIRVPLTPRLTTNSADAAIGFALAGGGLTMALGYQVKAEVTSGLLHVVLGDFEPPPSPIHVVYPTSRLLSPKVRAFVDRASKTDWRFVDFGRGEKTSASRRASRDRRAPA